MNCDHDWCDISAVDDTQSKLICLECGEYKFIPLEILSDETPKTPNQIAGNDTQAAKT